MRFQADLGGHIRNILIPIEVLLLLRTRLHLIKFIAFDLITFDAAGAPIIGGLWSFRYIYGISGRKTNSFSFINNVARVHAVQDNGMAWTMVLLLVLVRWIHKDRGKRDGH